jgi:hypothetical protein
MIGRGYFDVGASARGIASRAECVVVHISSHICVVYESEMGVCN